jgi:hypothetical protein
MTSENAPQITPRYARNMARKVREMKALKARIGDDEWGKGA